LYLDRWQSTPDVLQAGLAVNPHYVGWGVALVDLDNDGWQDVLQVNGHVTPNWSSRRSASGMSTRGWCIVISATESSKT
jgi:hypothetical protein